MGAGNVKAVYGLWGDLPDGAFRLLVYMAAVAMDDDTPPRFYGGRETLAFALGWFVEDAHTTDPAAIARRESAFKSVKRLVGVLKKAGAIRVLRPAAPGRTAEYGINLRVDRSLKDWDRSRPRGQKNDPHSGPGESAPTGPSEGNGANSFDGTGPKDLAGRGQKIFRMGPSDLAPQEEEEQERNKREEEMADVDLTSHRSRATEPTPRCAHGLTAETRPDGRPACALCRVAQDRPATAHPPPADGHLAPVIQLHTREAS